MSGKDRTAKHRRLRKAGRRCAIVKYDEFAAAEALLAAGLLRPGDEDDPEAVARAIQRAVDAVVAIARTA